MSSVASIGDVCIILKIPRYFRWLYLPFSDPKLRNAGDHVSKVSDLCWSFRPIIRNLILIKFLNLRKYSHANNTRFLNKSFALSDKFWNSEMAF